MFSYEFDNYDFTMCDDGLCSKKEQCHRFLAYQEIKQDKNKDKPTLVSLKFSNDKPTDGCILFWEEKKIMKTIKIPFTNKMIVDRNKYEQGQNAAKRRDGMIEAITALQSGNVEFFVTIFIDKYVVAAKIMVSILSLNHFLLVMTGSTHFCAPRNFAKC